MEKKSGRRTRAAPKKKKSVGKKVIAWVLIILLIVVAGLIGGYFLLRDQGMTYYVEYGGDRYYANSDGGNISLSRGENKFIVKSITGKEVIIRQKKYQTKPAILDSLSVRNFIDFTIMTSKTMIIPMFSD